MSSGAPTCEEWRLQVNDALLKERQVYQSRGFLDKFQKMWEPWIVAPGLVPFSIIPNGTICVDRLSLRYGGI